MRKYTFADRFLQLISTGAIRSGKTSKHTKGRRKPWDWRRRRKAKRKAACLARQRTRPLYSKRHRVKAKRHGASAHH